MCSFPRGVALLTLALALVFPLLASGVLAAGPTPKHAAAFSRLKGELDAVEQAGATLDPDAYQHRRAAIAAKAVQLVRTDPATPDAAEVLQWVLQYHWASDAAVEAAAWVAKHHINSALSPGLTARPTAWTGPLLQKAVDAKLPPMDRAKAHLLAAMHRQATLDVWDAVQGATADALVLLKREHGGRFVDQLRSANGAALETGAIQAFKEAARQHGHVNLGGMKVEKHAEAALFAIQHLRLGRTAPEIQGESIDGTELKLSSYRSKVVLLSFWATWCSPCVSDLREERRLVDEMRGRPFALIGVNLDSRRDRLPAFLKEHGVSWPSFWDGKQHAISNRWQARQLPTIYVIDHKQTIRGKAISLPEAERMVHRLVREAEGAVTGRE